MVGQLSRSKLVGLPAGPAPLLTELGASETVTFELPLGVARLNSGTEIVTRVDNIAVRLAPLAADRLLPGAMGEDVDALLHHNLDRVLALTRPRWAALREALYTLLSGRSPALQSRLRDRAAIPAESLQLVLPFTIGDYVDFNSSLAHATRVGALLRPDRGGVPENWRHIPVAYHGRSNSIVVSGTDVRRPIGGLAGTEPNRVPTLGKTEALDFEVELGFVVGPGTNGPRYVAPDDAIEYVFGVVLVNDWSARDHQLFESQPLGPFASKSFCTSISQWVTPMDALADAFMSPTTQDPAPLAHVRSTQATALDITLTTSIAAASGGPAVVSTVSSADMYWTFAQQLAHLTVNGSSVRPGDLFASGTVSNDEPTAAGCLLELTKNGAEPVRLANGAVRAFLEDGDTVTISGSARGPGGRLITLGEVVGRILPATPLTTTEKNPS